MQLKNDGYITIFQLGIIGLMSLSILSTGVLNQIQSTLIASESAALVANTLCKDIAQAVFENEYLQAQLDTLATYNGSLSHEVLYSELQNLAKSHHASIPHYAILLNSRYSGVGIFDAGIIKTDEDAFICIAIVYSHSLKIGSEEIDTFISPNTSSTPTPLARKLQSISIKTR